MGLLKKLFGKNEPVPEREPVKTVPKREPSPAQTDKQLDKIVYNNIRAESLMDIGRLDEAKELLESNLKNGADTPATYRNLSLIYRREQDKDNEIRVLKAGLNSVNPNNEKHYNSLKKRLDELTKPRTEPLTELDKIKEREKEYYSKLWDRTYYDSEESRNEAREIKEAKKEYIKNNPKDYYTRAVDYCRLQLSYLEDRPDEDRDKVLELIGMGLYYENDLEEYDKAIECYKKADKYEQETEDFLYAGKSLKRIGICENKLKRAKIKELEAEAKELEKTDPVEAIKKYEELNRLNPGLKKYNKRIEILKRKLD